MQSIKFMSLIVICATSCLALLLPAIGVVPFPSQLSGVHSHASANPGGAGEFASGVAGQGGSMPGADPWVNGGINPGLSQSGVGEGTMSGLPVSTSVSQNFSSSPTLSGSESQLPGNYLNSAATGQMGAEGALSRYDTVGFGIWLLLVPIWLMALVVWSIAPSSKGRSK